MKDSRAVNRVSFSSVITSVTRGRSQSFRGVALVSTLCCLAITGLGGCKGDPRIGATNGEVYGVLIGGAAAIAVGTIAAVEIHKGHHTVKGCVSSGQSGLELQDPNDKKTYALSGDTASLKTGDLVRLHGNKLKKDKHSTVEQTFAVTQVSKDYGPCKLTP